jgi:uncharacterized protein
MIGYDCSMKFVKTSVFAAPAATLWAFHERPNAFALLTPPWQRTEIIQPPHSLKVGTIVKLRVKMPPLPFWQSIEAEHIEYEAGRMFADRMNRGPFARWIHHHIITEEGPQTSRLTDEIEYALPFGVVGRVLGGGIARRQLEKLFTFRHAVTRKAVEG